LTTVLGLLDVREDQVWRNPGSRVSALTELMIEHTLDERIRLHKGLLDSDDVGLFTRGGCHIFALALHDRFKYPHCIPGHSGKAVSHIYCRFVGPPHYAVDVFGFTPEADRVWDFSGLTTPSMSREELLLLSRPLADGTGLCSDDWFVIPARQRAERSIDQFVDVFSGNRKGRIP